MNRTARIGIVILSAAGMFAAPRILSSKQATFQQEGNPLVRFTLPTPTRFTLSGHIEERLPAAGYVYLRIRPTLGDRDTERWLVVLRDGVPAADDIEATIYARAATFHSRRIGRDFAPLLFATVRASSHPSRVADGSPVRDDINLKN